MAMPGTLSRSGQEVSVELSFIAVECELMIVLGYSSDLMPFVGEHPDKPNLFVCAGFTGHG
jgi:glycine/D-amino acid oxidase-like deaminating enzyme